MPFLTRAKRWFVEQKTRGKTNMNRSSVVIQTEKGGDSLEIKGNKRRSLIGMIGLATTAGNGEVRKMEERVVKEEVKEEHFNDWPNSQGFDVTYTEHTPITLPITGIIPSYTSGVLFRTGLGPRTITPDNENDKTFRVEHWFDNLAQVHRFQLHSPFPSPSDPSSPNKCIEKVTYSSRSTCDGLITQIKKTGTREGVTFGAKYDPCTALFQKTSAQFIPATPPLTPPPMGRKAMGMGMGPGMKAPPPAWRERPKVVMPDEVSVAVGLSVNFPGLNRVGEAEEGAKPKVKGGIESLCNRTDTSTLQFLDPQTLEPIGVAQQSTLHPLLKGPSSGTHAGHDPVTNSTYNYNLEFHLGRGIYRIFCVDGSTGKTSILATITDEPAYIHSLLLTERYVVLCVWGAIYAQGGASILWTKNIVDALAPYEDDRMCKWYVIDRTPVEEGGRGLVGIYESEAFFCFHTVNAYEEEYEGQDGGKETRIVADVVAYRDLDVLKRLYIDNLLSTSKTAATYAGYENMHPEMRRFVLPSIPQPSSDPFAISLPTSNHLSLLEDQDDDEEGEDEGPEIMDALCEFTCPRLASPELPTINPAYSTKKHRFVYGVLYTGRSTMWDCLVKHDLEGHGVKTWWKGGCTPGEPIFVADPEGDEEDKGVLLSVVLDGIAGKSFLLCLDAQTMEEVGRVEVPGVVGFGFHGVHVGDL